MKNYVQILSEKEFQKSISRIVLDLKSVKDANNAMKILKNAGLEIGVDWDWITSTDLAIGKTAWKKVSNKLSSARNESFINEMPNSIIVTGAQFTKRDLKKLKKKYPCEDEFIKVLNDKLSLDSSDVRRLRIAFKEV